MKKLEDMRPHPADLARWVCDNGRSDHRVKNSAGGGRSSMKRRDARLAVAVALMAAAFWLPGPVSATDGTSVPAVTTSGTTLLAEYPAGGGRVLAHVATPAGFAWAVVRPGTTIAYEPVAQEATPRAMLTLVPPEPRTAEEAAAMVAEQNASGWTSDVQLALLDQLFAGVQPLDALEAIEPMRSATADAGDLEQEYFDEGCPGEQTSGGEVQLRGCYKRRWGQEYNGQRHAGAESFAVATNVHPGWVLTVVTVAHSYGAAQMKSYNPLSGFPQGECGTRSLSLSGYGVSVAQSQQICPERLAVTIMADGKLYGVDWRGVQRRVGDARATELLEIAGTPSGTLFGFKFHMDMQAEPWCPPDDPNECAPPGVLPPGGPPFEWPV